MKLILMDFDVHRLVGCNSINNKYFDGKNTFYSKCVIRLV